MRRLELLKQIGLSPQVFAANVDETPAADESALALVRRLSRAKASAVARELSITDAEPAVILGADTVVSHGVEILGKALTPDQGIAMLQSLSGCTHQVITGVCAIAVNSRQIIDIQQITVVSDVTMCDIDTAMAESYWGTGEPVGKAGSYALQGIGAIMIKHLQGSYSNVVGLPVYETARLLRKFGIECLS